MNSIDTKSVEAFKGKRVIFIDGDCVFCNKSAVIISKHDNKKHFWYSTLQNESAKAYFSAQIPSNTPIPDSIIYIDEKSDYFFEAEAIAKIFKLCAFPLNLAGHFTALFPLFLSNFVYRQIAKIRKKLVRKDSCEYHPEIIARTIS